LFPFQRIKTVTEREECSLPRSSWQHKTRDVGFRQ
jgi:hypothetical protein